MQILLKLYYRGLELLTEGLLEKVVDYGPVESLDKAVSLGPGNIGQTVIDIVEFQEDLVGMDNLSAAVLLFIVRRIYTAAIP
jgi:hypothetical protein